MATRTRTKALGIALHYFDPNASANGSDKFYRIYLYGTTNAYVVTSHWGRDGAANGQSKTETFDTWAQAKNYMVKLGDSKMRKGYEWLGEKEVDFDERDLFYTGQKLLNATGRRPTKIAGGGFALVIQEEADLMDLLMN